MLNAGSSSTYDGASAGLPDAWSTSGAPVSIVTAGSGLATASIGASEAMISSARSANTGPMSRDPHHSPSMGHTAVMEPSGSVPRQARLPATETSLMSVDPASMSNCAFLDTVSTMGSEVSPTVKGWL